MHEGLCRALLIIGTYLRQAKLVKLNWKLIVGYQDSNNDNTVVVPWVECNIISEQNIARILVINISMLVVAYLQYFEIHANNLDSCWRLPARPRRMQRQRTTKTEKLDICALHHSPVRHMFVCLAYVCVANWSIRIQLYDQNNHASNAYLNSGCGSFTDRGNLYTNLSVHCHTSKYTTEWRDRKISATKFPYFTKWYFNRPDIKNGRAEPWEISFVF